MIRTAALAFLLLAGRISIGDSSLHVCVSGVVERLKSIISIREGWRAPASLVRRFHNPGALRSTRHYRRYRNDRDGWRDLDRLIRSKLSAHADLRRAWTYLPSATGE